jgi:hypothetical protein
MVGGPSSRFFLRVHTTPKFEQPVSCTKVDLAEDEAGKLIGYRCKDEKAWNVIRLLGGDRRLLDCSAPVGEGGDPEFDQLPPVSDSVERILACATLDEGRGKGEGEIWNEVVRTVLEQSGPQRALSVARHLALRPPASTLGEDPFTDALQSLSDDAKAQAVSVACSALRDPGCAAFAYVRAARHCPLKAKGIAWVALLRFESAFAKVPSGERPDYATRNMPGDARWAAMIATANDPEGAGNLACKRLADDPGPDYAVGSFAFGAIALNHTPCAALGELDKPPCGKEVDCDGALCDAATLHEELSKLLEGATIDVVPGKAREELPTEPVRSRARLAALYAQGELPKSVSLRNARRHYTVETSTAPSCKGRLNRGERCSCVDPDMHWFCSIPETETKAWSGTCGFRIDDARKMLTDVRYHCRGEGEPCMTYGERCCEGFSCWALEYGGDARCIDESPVEPESSTNAPSPPASDP